MRFKYMRMKIARIVVDGMPLYAQKLDINFYAKQKVYAEHLDSLHKLFNRIYVNNVEAFVGINASGKTRVLELIAFVADLLSGYSLNGVYSDNVSITHLVSKTQPTVFDIDFFADQKIFHLKSEMICNCADDGSETIQIISEKLWEKSVTSRLNKHNFLDYVQLEPIRTRDNSAEYLQADVSIMIAVDKQIKERMYCIDRTAYTNFNFLIPQVAHLPEEIITLLDPSIEYLNVEEIGNRKLIRLKFSGEAEKTLLKVSELNAYLSSGTIKEMRIFLDAERVLKKGGYLIIDEVENHFNHELVVSLIRLFTSKLTNPYGAVIIFSTHYAELLDEIERNDAVFITRHKNGLTVDSLNDLIKRNDMKKSEVYQGNFLGGTAPKYAALHALEKRLSQP